MSNNAVTLANKYINENSFSSTREFTCEEMDEQTQLQHTVFYIFIFI